MEIVRDELTPNDVSPPGTRYDPTCNCFQTWNGSDWIDDPQIDPRFNPALWLPPRVTSDTRCDAAASMTRDIHDRFDQALVFTGFAGILNGFVAGLLSLALTGIGLIIDIVILIVASIVNLGVAVVDAALNETAYDQLECILYCVVDGDGRITSQEAIDEAKARIDTEIGGVAALMFGLTLDAFGVTVLNNAAALGSETGDCSECFCICEGAMEILGGHGYSAPWGLRTIFTTYACAPQVCLYDSGDDALEGCFSTINTSNMYAEAWYNDTFPFVLKSLRMGYSATSSRGGVGAFIQVYDDTGLRYQTGTNSVPLGTDLFFNIDFPTPITFTGAPVIRLQVGANAGAGVANMNYLLLCPE